MLRNNLSPLVVRLARGWENRGYKALKRRGEHIAHVTVPAAVEAAPAAPVIGPAVPGTLVLKPAPVPERTPAGNGNGHHGNGDHPWNTR